MKRTRGAIEKLLSLRRPRALGLFFGGEGGRVAEEGRSEGPPLVHIPAFSGLRHWSDPPRAQSEKYVPRAVKLFIEPL